MTDRPETTTPDRTRRAPSLGAVGVWSHLDTLGIAGARAYAARVEALGFGTLWVPETVGRDPFTSLGLLAGETSRMALGTSIASIWARDAQTTRMAAHTLDEATGGRFVLGLGVSHPHLAERLRGHVYDRPLAHMRDFLAAYARAIYKGPMPADGADPPILLAALREHMLALAAATTDGAFPYLVTPERVAWIRQHLDGAAVDRAAATGIPRARPVLAVTMPVVTEVAPETARATARAYLSTYLRPPAYQASWGLQGFGADDREKPGSDRLVDAMVAWGAMPAIWHRWRALRDAGADHVAIIPLSADGTTEDLATLEALAEAGLTS
ncbi:MAG TPA: LLM class flavin-dependent oxidoreductase [Candidatus Sulfotelmatobacter sp.]|nr:LLM class flavin-dependent oxidoreductase [Candidatus Sulfotelmatobacter sp.]